MIKKFNYRMRNYTLLLVVCVLAFASCKKDNGRSDVTGWKYGDQEWGGFEKVDFKGQKTGPNLIEIPGGTFTMGNTEEDVTYEWNNVKRRVTVNSFYMDETEVANINYREYLYDLRRLYGESFPDAYEKAKPDTLVWREELAFNEPLVETYFRYPAYNDYPVVGVTWEQATDFCVWRSNKVNEMLLIEEGILNPNPEQSGSEVFDKKAYLNGLYEGSVRKAYQGQDGTERNVRFEDGIFLPDYRLPTEAEWEYAALALHGTAVSDKHENIEERRTYAWSGHTARYKVAGKNQGDLLANFKRGRGDYMGVSSHLNDNAAVTAPCRSGYPNDFGLYNMSGNVNEWCGDVYRSTTGSTLIDVDENDLNPFRGNVFREIVYNEDGTPVGKDSLGRLITRQVADSTINRQNYNKADLRDYRDGDTEEIEYEYGVNTLVSNKSRVIKGGSWADRLYWLSPGNRRFHDQDRASKTIGFRCAMIKIGGDSPTTGESTGNRFKTKRKKKRRKY